MLTAYRSITTRFTQLRDLSIDINNFFQNPANYEQFDDKIRAVLLKNESHPDVDQLPHVKLIKVLRNIAEIIAKDFENKNHINIIKLPIDLTEFYNVVKCYDLTEETLCLSPEFNSKLVLFTHLVLHSNQIFHDQFKKIANNPYFTTNTQDETENDETKNWRYYRKQIITLNEMLLDDNKLKPYLQNAERALTFIIDLKEKGILKSNLIFTVLDFLESFNNASQTSLKEIFQEYAIYSENQIKEILKYINHFLSSFLAICDEVEINMGLKMGYLTQRLNHVLNFCNVFDHEFNQDNNDSSYPYTQNRLTRIQHSNEQTKLLLDAQTKRLQNLSVLQHLVKDFLHTKKIAVDDIVKLHEGIELLIEDTSVKKEFHTLVDNELTAQSNNLSEPENKTAQFQELLTKYKLHEASIQDATHLFELLNSSENLQEIRTALDHEYKEFSKNFQTILINIANGEILNKDIAHVLVMLKLFETATTDNNKRINLVQNAINKHIRNIQKLHKLLTQFQQNKLPEQDLYELIVSLDYLECDSSRKNDYKRLIINLDHKRKNYNYFTMLTDFATGLFVEVAVPYTEINVLIQNKLKDLDAIKQGRNNSMPTESIKGFQDVTYDVFPFFSDKSSIRSWYHFEKRIENSLEMIKEKTNTLKNILLYKNDRYIQLASFLNSYQPPKKLIVQKPTPPIKRRSLKKFIGKVVKSTTTWSTKLVTLIYSRIKSTYFRVKAFFSNKKNTPKLIITRNPSMLTLKPQNRIIDKSPYKELDFIEENLLFVLEKLINPEYHTSLRNAIVLHQFISEDNEKPYFYKQASQLANIYILLRKLILSYSHAEMVQFTIAVAELNAENKSIILNILNNSTLAQTSLYYNNVIKPTLANAYRVVANVRSDIEIDPSLPEVMHTLHESLQSIANNQTLNLASLSHILNRINEDVKSRQQTTNEDLLKIYASINNLTKFMEKAINNQDNFLVEILFSITHLIKQFRQLSTGITHLLIQDKFPYLKELSLAMQQLQSILVLLKSNLQQLLDAGLNPTIFNSLNEALENTNKFVDELTPIKFHQEHLLLDIGEIKAYIGKRSHKTLRNELNNMQLLLTNSADKNFIDEKLLSKIETRLIEIKQKINDTHSHSITRFFHKKSPFNQPVKSNTRQNQLRH